MLRMNTKQKKIPNIHYILKYNLTGLMMKKIVNVLFVMEKVQSRLISL